RPVVDDAVTGGSAMVDRDLQNDNLARKLAAEDLQHAVIAPHTNVPHGPRRYAAPRVKRDVAR
ncbi:MAG TPA: hypothetical protein VE621_09850, partial [Bryobacteraceae bacterium]|nr:hypothetical protein [Bryobacteraceae bacterium]